MHSLDNAFFDRAPVLLGNDAADNPINELVTPSPRQRFQFNPAVAVLPASPGLFFIPALPLGKSPYRLSVRYLRRLHCHLDAELPFKLLESNLKVDLPHAGEDHLLGFLITGEM